MGSLSCGDQVVESVLHPGMRQGPLSAVAATQTTPSAARMAGGQRFSPARRAIAAPIATGPEQPSTPAVEVSMLGCWVMASLGPGLGGAVVGAERCRGCFYQCRRGDGDGGSRLLFRLVLVAFCEPISIEGPSIRMSFSWMYTAFVTSG